MESVLDSTTAHKAGNYANGQVNHFLDSVDDLTKALKDIDTPDVARSAPRSKWPSQPPRAPWPTRQSQIGTQAKRVGNVPMASCVTIPGSHRHCGGRGSRRRHFGFTAFLSKEACGNCFPRSRKLPAPTRWLGLCTPHW